MFKRFRAWLNPPPRPPDPPCTECRHRERLAVIIPHPRCMAQPLPSGGYHAADLMRLSWHCDYFEPLTCKAEDAS